MRVKIGDVVNKIVGDEDRLTTHLKYYIGGEHISSGQIKIYDKGLLDSDKGRTLGYQFHYPFAPRDVLFMTKNPYLKKCGIVDFEGICSIATFVMRSKDESILLQEYLAIVMQTESVWNYLEANKSGSVNYFITWKTLEAYEFELPTIEEQRKIVEVVWQMEDTRNKYERLLAATDELVKSQFIEMFGEYRNITKQLSDIIIKGPQNGFYRKGAEINGTIPIIKMKELFGNEAVGEALQCDLVSLTESEIERFTLTEDDLVFGRRSLVVEGAGKCRRVGKLRQNTVFESSMLRVTLNKEVVKPRYVQSWFESDDGVNAIAAIRAVTTIAGIKGSDLANVKIPIAPIELQNRFIEIAEQSDKSKTEIKKCMEKCDMLLQRVINQAIN